MKNVIGNVFKKKYGFVVILLIVLLVSLGAFMLSSQNNTIVGTWIDIHSTSTATRSVYTADGKAKFYIDGQLQATELYELSKTPNHCGFDLSKRLELNPEESILILTDTKANKKYCFLVYKLTEDRFISSPFGSASIDSLKKVQ